VGPQEPLAEALLGLPKVELHVHLEGAVTAEQASRLARRHGEDPRAALVLEDGRYPRRFRDFDHFLETFLATSAQLRTPEDLAEVAAAFAREQERQGVRWTEVTFTAATHVGAGMDARAMWAALRDGLRAAPGCEIGLIVDTVRDAGRAGAEHTVALVEDADAPIVGLGLTGTEGSVPEREFRVLREAADRLGVGLTVHAGETGTAANVRAAVDDLGADRIGHGLAALDDPALTRRLAADQVPLEVCPSSNVALGLVASIAEHPLPRMVDASLAVTIGSDAPSLFSTTLTEELGHAMTLLRATPREVADLQRRAAEVSFAPRRVKAELAGSIDAWQADATHG
jgi:aminodeoxyfutalosine deaminase